MFAHNDAAIPDNYLEAWTREIANWADARADVLWARNALIPRKVGEDVQIDVVVTYTKTGTGAQVVSKGGVPTAKTGIASTTNKQDIYQIMDQFQVHEKDLKSDPSMYSKELDMCLRNVHQLEDDMAINGNAALGLSGVLGMAAANPNGKIVNTGASGNDLDNNGAWTELTALDPYADILDAVEMLGSKYDPVQIGGNRKDLARLFRKDKSSALHEPWTQQIAPLLGYSPSDNPYKTWLKTSSKFPRGKVVLMSKDADAGEFVVSENPYPDRLPKAAGGNFPVEIKSWSVPRLYDEEGFVVIDIT